MITIPNTPQQQSTSLTGKAHIITMQNLLERIKARIEPGYEPQITSIEVKKKEVEVPEEAPLTVGWKLEGVNILEVEKDGVAATATLQPGDIITEINLVPATDIKDIDALVLEKLNAGNAVMLVCERSGEMVVITLKREQ